MTAFRFRLDPVLRHRERIERERAAEHAQKVIDQREAQRVLDTFTASREATRSALTRDHGKLEATTLRATYSHLQYLDREIAAARRRVDACAADTEAARREFVAAATARNVLDLLRERRRTAHELDAALAEERECDDVNARLFARARRPSDWTSGAEGR